jgi:hypothetical protein
MCSSARKLKFQRTRIARHALRVSRALDFIYRTKDWKYNSVITAEAGGEVER